MVKLTLDLLNVVLNILKSSIFKIMGLLLLKNQNEEIEMIIHHEKLSVDL
jgi:hypothetical protein